MSWIVPFCVDKEKDPDIARWLEGQPEGKRSEAIRAAIRLAIGQSLTIADIYHAVSELQDKLAHGVVTIQADGEQAPDSDPNLEIVKDALDGLGL